MKKLLILLAITLTGCSQIQHYNNVDVNMETNLTTSIGGKVFGTTKTKDLPNAFGKADIWGGKVNTGHSELRFQGLTEDNKIVFRFMDVTIHSDESVFSRYGRNTSTISANDFGGLTVTHNNKPEARISQLPPNTTEFLFPVNEKKLSIGGYNIEIISVTSYSLTYKITN
ncbi:peptidase [Vibrio alfacsensis]|uniref:peptidase n=1 Tax=Vibrio TaxID=662 RepID=UPI004067ED7E